MVSSVPPIRPSVSVARVEHREQVGAVVDRDLRLALGQRADVLRVGVEVLAAMAQHLASPRPAPPPRRPAWTAGWRRERDLRATRAQRAHEVRRLGRHVQARGEPEPVERPLALEALADGREDGHLPVRPRDAGLPSASVCESCALVAVVLRLVRTLDRHADVRGLVGRSSVSFTPSASRCRRATFSSRCFGST